MSEPLELELQKVVEQPVFLTAEPSLWSLPCSLLCKYSTTLDIAK